MSNKKSAKAGPDIPAEAKSKGGVNESPSQDEKTVDRSGDLDGGPNRGEAGEYLPASYKVSKKTNEGDFDMVRHDR